MRLINLFFLVSVVCLGSSCDQQVPVPACPPFSQDFLPSSDQELFLDLAFGEEFGSPSERLRKWNEPVSLFIQGTASEAVLSEIDVVIEELNQLSSSEIRIDKVTDRSSSNFILFLGEKDAYINEVEPAAAGFALGNSGFVSISWNEEFEIIRASACIDVVNFSGTTFFQHVIREELAQGLGLINDTDLVDSTIFHQTLDVAKSYTEQDHRMIGYMLGNDLSPGMCPREAIAIIK